MTRNHPRYEAKPIARILTAADFKRISSNTLETAIQNALARAIKDVFAGTKYACLYIDGNSIPTIYNDGEIDYDPQWINQVKSILEGWGFNVLSHSGPHFSKSGSRDNFHVKISWS